jgi:hypothetical protein
MLAARTPPVLRTIPFLIAVCLFSIPAQAKYSGGSGTAQDPYQIATSADLIALGETPADYDKHFVLTANIDLDPSLPGRKVFDEAVIAQAVSVETGGDFQGTSFTGVFDGKGHTISHLTIKGGGYLGLFGYIDMGSAGAEVKNLGVVDVNLTGSGDCVAGLVGYNCRGTVTQCYSTGAVSGGSYVGGLVGNNEQGTVTQCYSTGAVNGSGDLVGGLVGSQGNGCVTQCYCTGAVRGHFGVGGLMGLCAGTVTYCYSTGAVTGSQFVGGLAGYRGAGFVTQYYHIGAVIGSRRVDGLIPEQTGGLVGVSSLTSCFSFWDTQTSGQTTRDDGTGKTTAEMHDIRTYLDAGWQFVGELKNGTCQVWQMPEGGGCPVLAVFHGYTAPQLQGAGTAEHPYLISNAMELGAMAYYSPRAHYRLTASIDLSGIRWGTAVIPWFGGSFDGNGHTISHLTIYGEGCLGLFGWLGSGAEVRDLGGAGIDVAGSGNVGGLAGGNEGALTQCHSTGAVSGKDLVGGLVGHNPGQSDAMLQHRCREQRLGGPRAAGGRRAGGA